MDLVISVHSIAQVAGAKLVNLKTNLDLRGSFTETYRQEWFPELPPMIQSNRSDKVANCVVGLHYHLFQADYWYVVAGRARIVLYDLRVGSPTEKGLWSQDVSGDDSIGIYVPPGVGHGFSSLTDLTLYYQVDSYYNPEDELGVLWNDPDLGIDWGLVDPVISERDSKCKLFSQLTRDELPRF